MPKSRPPIEQVLVEGFETTVFDLKKASDAPGTYAWQRMEGAQYVQCALFICPPEVRREGGSRDGMKWIVNFHECALSTQFFSLSGREGSETEFTFSLAGMSPNSESGSCGAAAACREGAAAACGSFAEAGLTSSLSRVAVVTTLNLGCWASDSRSVVGASSLLAIDPAELPQFSRPVLNCGAPEGAEGELCVASAKRGQCHLGTCVLLEESASGQPDAGGADAGVDAGPAPAPSFQCGADGQDDGRACLRPDALGVCRERVCRQVGDRPPATLLVSECGSGNVLTDGLNCFPSVTGMVGTCDRSRCRARCHENSDCEGLGRDGGHLRCERGNAYVGKCVE